jgi:L-amino acid N-acyltransferase YncA
MIDAPPFRVRPATRDDAGAITRIYNEGIRGRGATFETRERAVSDVLPWFDDPRFPLLVATEGAEVVGWAAASSYRARACYAGIAEYSIYVATSHHGRGVGRMLMPDFLQALEAAGFWKVLSRLFPENTASRALCARFGFREVGVYERHGQLDGVWRDVVIVERLLGASSRPSALRSTPLR